MVEAVAIGRADQPDVARPVDAQAVLTAVQLGQQAIALARKPAAGLVERFVIVGATAGRNMGQKEL